ncbi:MAG TPA: hypothetical protein VFN22_00045 [Gemmatimonadales bacterium]|nr:hypothetical protein [Gemmatimonadales bacterium]
MQLRFLSALAMLTAAPTLAVGQDQPVIDGKLVFATTCAACHSLMPPMTLAPPMVMVARHYREKFTSDSAGIGAIARFVIDPDSSRSALPAHAIERFGLMPKQPTVSPAQAHAVARYVWNLSDTTATPEH